MGYRKPATTLMVAKTIAKKLRKRWPVVIAPAAAKSAPTTVMPDSGVHAEHKGRVQKAGTSLITL